MKIYNKYLKLYEYYQFITFIFLLRLFVVYYYQLYILNKFKVVKKYILLLYIYIYSIFE